MWSYNYTDELYHYGIPGMKWGHRKAIIYEEKARKALDSAKKHEAKTKKYEAKSKKYEAKSISTRKPSEKYEAKAKKYEAKAKKRESKNVDSIRLYEKYEAKSKSKEKQAKFQGKQADVEKSRTKGSKFVTSILAGPYANRTYNSVIAAGGSKHKARAVTLATTIAGGQIGHIAVSALYTHESGKGTALNRF